MEKQVFSYEEASSILDEAISSNRAQGFTEKKLKEIREDLYHFFSSEPEQFGDKLKLEVGLFIDIQDNTFSILTRATNFDEWQNANNLS